jgi:hypothetical protein
LERRAGDGSAVVSSSGISGCDSSTLLMAVPRAKVASEEDEECEEARPRESTSRNVLD